MHYLDNYYGSVLDPLHGDIKLSEIEKWIISQPIFSRLRGVKQNTFLYYVFPSANHTRFEHSIGVMHIAGKIFESCKDNFATGSKKRKKYEESESSSFFDLNSLGANEGQYYQELRLAALLHDVGHGPLSHLFDEFAISPEPFLSIVDNTEFLRPYKEGFTELIKKNNNKVEHELISCVFIFSLIDQLKNDGKAKFSEETQNLIEVINAEHIVKIIEPDFPNLGDFTDAGGNVYTSFFSRIVTAFPIDADRMDYLLRDSYFSGVTYGVYDINRVFASFLAMRHGNEIYLAFKESGVDSVLRFIQSRTHLYNQVYFHKTNRAANTMLGYATETNRGKKLKLLDDRKNLDELRDFYLENSDETFLQKTVPDHLLSSPEEIEVHRDLIRRKLFKRVFQEKIVFLGNNKSKRARLVELKRIINDKLKALLSEGILATTDYYENVTFKDADKKVVLAAIKNDEGGYSFSSKWQELNAEFVVSNLSVSMIRIYLKRDFNSPQEFKKFRDDVRQTVKQEIEELKQHKISATDLKQMFG